MSKGPEGPSTPRPEGRTSTGHVASTPLLAVDTGGTFTDLVLLDGGDIRTLKVPSTPDDPARAVLEGIREILSYDPDFLLLHGSTVATNALLERRGARVFLVTNEGFEDVIEIGRQNRPQLYALVGHRLPPLVAREDRLGLKGRLGPAGEEITPLDEARLAELADEIGRRADAPPQEDAGNAPPGNGSAVGGSPTTTPDAAVAICLLHSYADPTHEEAVAQAMEELGMPVSVSSRLLPEFREYERTSTTVMNAYVAPVMDRYLGRLADEAGAERVTIMGSNGGALPIHRAREEPVHTVLSGPAGGVVGALTWAKRAGHESILSFDMGGTSTDVSLCPGRPLRTREFVIGGQPAAIPVLDIHTVGAGGGSIARVDAGGALRVGPQSAGAAPGPICYGRGGEEVTVTDAHVWLGRLPADAFLGGDRSLDREAVEPSLRRIADALGSSLDDAAEGVLAVADAAMERALRVISVERGYDPVDFAVVAFGGAGALHVAELTQRLGATKALVPPDPGLLSAYGMLASPVTREASRTVLLSTAEPDVQARLETALDDLQATAHAAMVAEGADAEELSVERWIDVRYQGQSFELGVPADGWRERFHAAHQERYGYRRDETPLEAVTVRVVVSAPPPVLDAPRIETSRGAPPLTAREVVYRGERRQASSVWRSDLQAGHELAGPVIVQEYSGTTWVPPEWTLRVDEWGCLHLTLS
ncbi:MAG: hydantoinase/oxoprolinase family protein [Longimicrobiales bacterium]|nr:hydantoinase/oxoprolinase family protein [Longimicrobiales bacterium]